MTFNHFDTLERRGPEHTRDSSENLSSGAIHLGVRVLELSYGTGGSVALDPEHEDAKRYPNPRKPEDAPPPQDQPPTPPKWL